MIFLFLFPRYCVRLINGQISRSFFEHNASYFQNTNSNKLGFCVSFVTFCGKFRRVENPFFHMVEQTLRIKSVAQSRSVPFHYTPLSLSPSLALLFNLAEKDTVILQCCYHAEKGRATCNFKNPSNVARVRRQKATKVRYLKRRLSRFEEIHTQKKQKNRRKYILQVKVAFVVHRWRERSQKGEKSCGFHSYFLPRLSN